MTKLATAINKAGAAFQANDTHNRALAAELSERTAHAALGGPEASRQRPPAAPHRYPGR